MKTENVKHTPGPWNINCNAIEASFYSESWNKQVPASTELVAHVYDNEEGPITGDWRANARLIVAAPDMLAALKRLDKFCSNNSYPKIQGIWQDAIDAIAKAEGRA